MESTPRLFQDEVDVLQGLAPWLGGKRALAGRIVKEILRIPHRCYAEPFIGMGGVFMRRPRRAAAEVINDASDDVVTLVYGATLLASAALVAGWRTRASSTSSPAPAAARTAVSCGRASGRTAAC